MEAKRAACLYRVSTKGQVDKNDIPMQKSACRNFILQKGWKLVKEYQEQGVSGYRKTKLFIRKIEVYADKMVIFYKDGTRSVKTKNEIVF